jgi:outer membrane protein assembly factor BamB
MVAEKREKASERRPRKHRRVHPCTNHPNIPAVARCEACGKPICKKCVNAYEGPTICSDACWNSLVGPDHKKAVAKERVLRKEKEKKADRAVTVGLWATAVVVVGVIAVFIIIKMADKTGEKLWETSGSGYSHNYSTDPYSTTVLFAYANGTIKALNARNGTASWTVNLPKGERPSHPQLIDDNTCIVHSGNNVFLCDSSRSVPVWKLTTPQRAIYGKPVVNYDTLFVASSTGYSYYESYYSYGIDLTPLAVAISEEMSMPLDSILEEDEEDEPEEETDDTVTSTITSADLGSGREKWSTVLEDVRIAGLLVDEDRIFAAGYRPRTYEEYSAYLEESYAKDDEEQAEEEEDLGTTQLWALDVATGEPEWKLEGTGSFVTAPIMSDEGIVFATRQNVYLVSPEGQIKWTYPLIRRFVLSIEENESTLLLSTIDGSLMCLDLASGKKMWMTPTGAPSGEIIATDNLICVPGGTVVSKKPRKVIPTKRWRGSEDLLAASLKRQQEPVYEPNLMALNPNTGETLWKIDKVEGSYEYADGVVYVLSHHTQYLLLDASADSSEIAKQVSYLNAYDAATGKQIWRLGIDGVVSDLKLSFGTALVIAYPMVLSTAANEGRSSPVRLIAIALR